jgi:hypothetical protein
MPLGLGITLGVAGGSRALLDSDALSYITRAGISSSATTPTAYSSNNLTYSQDFTNAIWGGSAVSISANATIAPDSTNTASKIVESTANTLHEFYYIQNVTVNQIGAPCTWSIYVKSAERSSIGLWFSGYKVLVYDLVGLTVTAQSGGQGSPTGTITNVGNGWFRITYSCIMTTTQTPVGMVILNSPTSYNGYAGTTGYGIYIWGAQVENASTPSQYIQTTTTAVSNVVMASTNTRNLINNFVKGVKALGLWNNMVCWPLRSSQNKGTGTIAYSLGGLGTYNGTLTNGPTWGSVGISVNAGSGFLATNYSLPFFSSAYTAIAVCRFDPSYNHIVPRVFGVSGIPPSIYDLTGSVTASPAELWNGSSSTQVISTYDWSKRTFSGLANTGTGSALGFIDGNFLSSTPPTTPTSSYSVAFMRGESWNWSGDASFAAIIRTTLNQTTVEALRTLYKSTLGVGLGLV